jgi:hypothetical protein
MPRRFIYPCHCPSQPEPVKIIISKNKGRKKKGHGYIIGFIYLKKKKEQNNKIIKSQENLYGND